MNQNHTFTTIICFFQQPMQIQITTHLNPNYHYYELAKDFIEKFAISSTFGINATAHYYNQDTMVSLNLYHSDGNQIFELIGHEQLKNKMLELGIQTVGYNYSSFVSQPMGKKKIIINTIGKIEINSIHYHMFSLFLIKITSGFPKIMHQILNIML